MRAEVRTPGKILLSFSPYLFPMLGAFLFYGMLITFGSIFGLSQILDREVVKILGPTTGIGLTISLSYLCVRFILNKLRRARLEIEGDTLIFHGISGWKFLRKEFEIRDISLIAMGEAPNIIDRLAAGGTQTKASRLVLQDAAGKKRSLDHVANIFTTSSLHSLLVELSKRGVTVQ